jgi:hypothetical protein
MRSAVSVDGAVAAATWSTVVPSRKRKLVRDSPAAAKAPQTRPRSPALRASATLCSIASLGWSVELLRSEIWMFGEAASDRERASSASRDEANESDILQ